MQRGSHSSHKEEPFNPSAMDGGVEYKEGGDSSTRPLAGAPKKPRAVVSFAWHDVRCSYVNKTGQEKEVLHGVSGHLDGGQMLAVMGPSGSGKTCLMDVLAGRKSVGRVSASRLVNGCEIDSSTFKQLTAYVSQEDVFHPTATVQEAIMFQAHLKLGPDESTAVKQSKVLQLLEDTGLQAKAADYVGGDLPGGLSLRGLSGGEKRRLSLCCAAITDPALLFIDEPTSGLDSFSALIVMKQLRAYCQDGIIVMCTIHQPRSAIWSLFERVLILSAGHELYFGPTDKAESWFSDELGYVRPHDASTADYLLDVINVDFDNGSRAVGALGYKVMQSCEELQVAATCFQASSFFKDAVRAPTSGQPRLAYSSGASSTPMLTGFKMWFWQFRVLLRRCSHTYTRNPGNVMARVSVALFVSLLQVAMYFKTGTKAPVGGGLALNITGSMFCGLVSASLMPFNAITTFLYDRHFFMRESAGGLYCHSAYYLAYSLLEAAMCTFNAVLMVALVYPLLAYRSFIPASAWSNNLLNYLSIMIVQVNVSNQTSIFWSLLSPNQDVARAINSGWSALCLFAAGYMVPRPQMGHAAMALSVVADLRYSFQAMMINMLTGTKQEIYLDLLDLKSPSTIAGNLLCSSAFYFVALCAGYVCLRFLHKERR